MLFSRRIVLILPIVPLTLVLAACADSGGSGGQPAVRPGAPAFFWHTAKRAWLDGDYIRVSENLAKVTESDNEYRARGQALQLLVSSGLTQGYMEAAAAFDIGAKANPKNTTTYRKLASAARSAAKASALQSVEALHYYANKVKDESLPFDIGAPAGTLNEPPGLLRIRKGALLSEAELENVQRAMLQKGVLASASRAVGAANDSAKTIDQFKQQPLQLSRTVFLLGMGAGLSDQMALFGPKQLDEPVRQKLLATVAMEAIKTVPATKESKDVEKKLEKVLKQIRVG